MLGIIATKKKFKKAVDRNRAKRRLRELFKNMLKEEKIKNGKYVLIADNGILEIEHLQLKNEFEKCLQDLF